MYTVKLLTQAEIEVAEACKWYNNKQKGLGKRFLNEFDHYIELIAKNPLQFPIRFSEKFRFATLNDFPYLIVFKIQDNENLVYVMSVFHTSRNPINL